MLEWLMSAATEPIDWQIVSSQLALSVVAGFAVAAIFAVSQRKIVGAVSLLTTLVMLTVLVTMSTSVIGDNTARAFGLVGALSIVRFRTVVPDTRDTAFVIFAVVVGMGIGSGHVNACLIGIPLVGVVAIALGQISFSLGEQIPEQRLEVRFGLNQDPDAKLGSLFQTQLKDWRMLSVSSAKQGTALDVAYAVRLKPGAGPVALIQTIQGLEGVLSAELTAI